MEIRSYSSHHLVKSEDLNHHGSLYAGRGADWFVESGFIAASSFVSPKHLVCAKIHGMQFSTPAYPGQVVCFESKVVHAGRTSLTVYVKVHLRDLTDVTLDGFITFVHVDEHTRPAPHGIELEARTPEDIRLQQMARDLKKA